MQIAHETARAEKAGNAGPARTRPGPGALKGLSTGERVVAGLGVATAVTMLVNIWLVFMVAPLDAVQGEPFRIFYFHVPIAWVAYLAFFIVFVASILYLWRKDERWDWLARSAAEIGTVFTTLVLITGSLWGRTIWNSWWAWDDPRLTTTFILWFIYVGYLMLRSYTGRTASGARAAAVLGIIGFVDVPIDYLSVTWWRTAHPPTTYVQSVLPTSAGTVLMFSLATFTLLFSFLLVLVYHLQRAQAGTEKLRGRIED